ncbi:MAG: peptidoglycan DD-metalloendopeptidase family protein [Pleurocapsa sp.]
MLNNNVSSLKKQFFNTKHILSINNISRNNRYIIPLATAAICLLNLNQSAVAIDIKAKTAIKGADDLSSSSLTHRHSNIHQHEWEQEHHHNSSGLLPRLLSLITYPFRNQSSFLPQADLPPKQTPVDFYSKSAGGSSFQDLAPIYLSQANSSSAKEFLTAATIKSIQPTNSSITSTINLDYKLHTVEVGDTINLIAQKYQVSSQELVALNKIKDFNMILVDQKLKIPATTLNGTQTKIITLTTANFPQNAGEHTKLSNTKISPQSLADARLDTENISKLEIKPNILAKNLQEQRLANLRADINQMRAEIKRERQNNNEALDLASSDLVSSTNPAINQNADSISEELVSLQLPPLPPSEEYLPEAFDGYSWPAQGVLSSGYGWRWGRLHKGIDIAAPVGAPIFEAASGEVISAGWNSGGYGYLVKLQHLDGSMTLYAHNNRILGNNGQRVSKGEQIAEMGNTGFSTGSHLHFEIHSRDRGVVDPLALLSK